MSSGIVSQIHPFHCGGDDITRAQKRGNCGQPKIGHTKNLFTDLPNAENVEGTWAEMMKEKAQSGEHPDLAPPPKQKKENKKNKKNRTDEFDDVTPDEDVEKKQAVTERKPMQDFDFSQFADDIAAASYYAAKELVYNQSVFRSYK